MKHFLPLIMLFAASGCCQQGGNTTLSATQTPMHIEGRYASLDDGSISFDWSGVYIDIRFTGTYLAMEASDTKRNFFNHTLDGEAQEKFTTEGTTLPLYSSTTRRLRASTSSVSRRLRRLSRDRLPYTPSLPTERYSRQMI